MNTVLIVVGVLILLWALGSSSAKVNEKLSCLAGQTGVNGKCLINLTKISDSEYTGDGLKIYQSAASDWSKDRWLINGKTGIGRLYSNRNAATLGDIQEWRTTTNYIVSGDKKIPDFNLVKHGDKYYLQDNYRELLNNGLVLFRK
jgi:hypothetical protein